MGQQQLLLIVLGVIIVGIAIVVGINLFNANAESSTKDSIISEGNNIGAIAQQYYMKPTSMGGGGNNFTGLTSAYFSPKMLTTPDASWAVGTGTATKITFTGTPSNTSYKWTVTTTVDSSGAVVSTVQ